MFAFFIIRLSHVDRNKSSFNHILSTYSLRYFLFALFFQTAQLLHLFTPRFHLQPEVQRALLPRAPLGLQRIYGSHLLHSGRAEEAAEVLRRVAMEAGFFGAVEVSPRWLYPNSWMVDSMENLILEVDDDWG